MSARAVRNCAAAARSATLSMRLVTDPATPGTDLPAKFRLRQQAIQDWISGFRDRESLLAALESAGVAWGDVRDSADVFAGGAHSVSVPGSERRVTALPYHFSAAQPVIRRRAPRRGEHNTEVLAEWLGLDQAAVDGLAARGVLIAS